MSCVLDDFSRECLALVADRSLSGLRLVRELDGNRRPPAAAAIGDNGTQLTSVALLRWSQKRAMAWHNTGGQPQQGGVCGELQWATA